MKFYNNDTFYAKCEQPRFALFFDRQEGHDAIVCIAGWKNREACIPNGFDKAATRVINDPAGQFKKVLHNGENILVGAFQAISGVSRLIPESNEKVHRLR